MFFILPCIDNYIKVDLRVVSFDVPPQEILTRDSVTVSVDAVTYFRISSPVDSVCNIEDATRSTKLLAQTTLRNELGTKNLSEVLMERESISRNIQQILDNATDPWGVKVERVEVKDVRLPQMLQRAMAAEAEASREAKAKVGFNIILVFQISHYHYFKESFFLSFKIVVRCYILIVYWCIRHGVKLKPGKYLDKRHTR